MTNTVLNNSNGFETCMIFSENDYGMINLFDRNGKLGFAQSGQKE